MKRETLCVHSGTLVEEARGGVNSPVFTSTSYEYMDRDEQLYPRYFNTPNQRAVVDKLCALEGAESGVLFSSGMAAISSTLLALAGHGEHIVMQQEVYGGSRALAADFLGQNGFDVSFAAANADALIEACRDQTRIIYLESPTNPLLSVVDLGKVADFARSRGIVTVVDNTFATPILQNPIEFGIDVVVHSGTKYLGGHSDLSCGVAVASAPLVEKIRNRAILLGGSLNSQQCALLERSLKTLALRVERQSANAAVLAQRLAGNAAISKVFYPGLKTHPQHSLAGSQMRQFGAMLSFEPASCTPAEFLSRLRLVRPALSLGGVESVICEPARTSHVSLPEAERRRLGISPALLRLSVGIENVDDLIEDIERALFEV